MPNLSRDLLSDVPYNLLDHINLNLKAQSEGHSDLVALAVSGANKSYSIYTNCPSGCSCKTTSGKQYEGFYIESAAYNPSLSPLHTMLINLWAEGGAWDDIEKVVLIEHKNAAVSQIGCARAMLERVFPQAQLEIEYLQK